MTAKDIVTLFVSIIIMSTFSAGLSLDSDSVSDYVDEETSELEEKVQNTTDEATDEVLEEKTVSGTLIPTTDSLSARIDEVRGQIPVNAPSNSYILLSEQNTFLVFSDRAVEVGEYQVAGNQFPSFEINNENYATLVANSVTDEEPKTVSPEELERNIRDYRYQEVSVSGTLREVSFSTDSQTYVASPVSFGALTSMEPLDENVAANLRNRAEKLSKNPNWDTMEEEFGISESRIPIIDLNKRYWTNSEAEVTGIVLAAEDALRIKDAVNPQTRELIHELQGEGVLYVESVDYGARQTDLTELHELEPGQNVRFEGKGVIRSLSMQETLSASGISVPVDAVLKAGIITDEEAPEESVIVVGASPRKGQITSTTGGKYEIKGKTISAQSLDSSFPSNRKIVVLHHLERTSEIDNILERNEEIASRQENLEAILKGEDVEYTKEPDKESDSIEENSGKDDSSNRQPEKNQREEDVERSEETSENNLAEDSSTETTSDQNRESSNNLVAQITSLLGF